MHICHTYSKLDTSFEPYGARPLGTTINKNCQTWIKTFHLIHPSIVSSTGIGNLHLFEGL
jgi:hypothetical protein